MARVATVYRRLACIAPVEGKKNALLNEQGVCCVG
jgi:hypothetical protein